MKIAHIFAHKALNLGDVFLKEAVQWAFKNKFPEVSFVNIDMINIPFIMLLILASIGLGLAMEQHGKPKKGRNNGWGALIGWILQIGLTIWAIWWGF